MSGPNRSDPGAIAKGAVLAALAALLLTGCSKAGPEREPDTAENAAEVMPASADPAPIETERPAPKIEAEPVANSAAALPPEEDPSREAQMLEDADATGLTARAARGESPDEGSADPIGDLVDNGGAIAH